MNITPVSPVNTTVTKGKVKLADETVKPREEKKVHMDSSLDSETRYALDQATGLLQSIISDRISDKVLRKMPTDEYLHLLSLLDEIVNGSIDKRI